jgi:hypothetical protein
MSVGASSIQIYVRLGLGLGFGGTVGRPSTDGCRGLRLEAGLGPAALRGRHIHPPLRFLEAGNVIPSYLFLCDAVFHPSTAGDRMFTG